MKSIGLRGVRRGGYRPRTTDSRPRLTSSPNLVRQVPAPRRPDQVWVGDITYIPMESFWGTLKAELMLGRRFQTLAEARFAIFEYIEVFYNRKRLHSALGYQTPVDFEANLN